MGFNTLYHTNKTFRKIKNSGSFFLHSREDILKTLLNSHTSEKYQKLFIIMPTYEQSNVFEHLSQKAQTIQNKFISLSQQVSINIIFVLKDCNEFLSNEFIEMIDTLSKTIKIQLIYKSSIEHEVHSIDFILTEKQNFVVSKYLREENPPFFVYKDKHTIIQHQNSFYKIEKRAILYSEFKKNPKQLCHNFNPVNNRIQGEWFHYFYGSQREKNKIKFWINKLIIYLDNSVEYFLNGIKIDNGEFKVLGKQILLTFMDETKNSSFIVFEKEEVIEKIFIVKMLNKQYRNQLDMFTIGIFSKSKITEEEAKEILGKIEDVRILEKREVKRRVDNFLIKTEGYYNRSEL